MQDMRELESMGMVDEDFNDEMERSLNGYKDQLTGLTKRLGEVDSMPTQESKAVKHTPKHMKQPLAKNLHKRHRNNSHKEFA